MITTIKLLPFFALPKWGLWGLRRSGSSGSLLYPVMNVSLFYRVELYGAVGRNYGNTERRNDGLFMIKKKLILASGSPRRKKMFEDLGIEFEIIKSGVDEIILKNAMPETVVVENALLKANAVFKNISGRKEYSNAVVIGADTIVVMGDGKKSRFEIIGKPESGDDARRILRSLSDSVHYVYTGLAVIDVSSGKKLTGYGKSTVRMKKLSSDEIEGAAVKHLDKAGAYGIQEEEDAFVTILEGDKDNVVGLPMNKLRELLNKIGVYLIK